MRRIVWLCLVVWLSGCGEGNPEVWLVINGDSSRPCLGASHMKVRIGLPEGDYKYDEFGLFFKPDVTEDFRCEIPEYHFSQLKLSDNVQVEITLWDSSTEDMGILAQGSTIAFNVKSGSPTQELRIDLARKPGVQQGTVMMWEPSGWFNMRGVRAIQFRVTPQGGTQPVRSWYFAYDAETRPNPFPLLISNLPTPQDLTPYEVVVEALDANQAIIQPWTGMVYLQQGEQTLGFVELNPS